MSFIRCLLKAAATSLEELSREVAEERCSVTQKQSPSYFHKANLHKEEFCGNWWCFVGERG